MSEDRGGAARRAQIEDADVFDDSMPAKRRRKGPRIAGILVLIVVLLAAATIGYYLNRTNHALDQVARDSSMMPGSGYSRPPSMTASPGESLAPVAFLIMGSDSRGTDQGRSDVLMMAYLTGDRQHVYLISFPRDMWVPIPNHGTAKINAAYAYGGSALSIATIESLTGVRIEHAATMDFPGFVQLTTALGGITVNNVHSGCSAGYCFPAGQITVEGDQALAYVRERHDLPGGDFDRAERQRAVVTGIIGKMMSRDTIANPIKFGEVMDQIGACMTVDSDFTNDKVRSLASSVRFTGSAGVRSMQAPISGTGTSADGQSIDVVDQSGLSELSKALQTDAMDTYWAKHHS